MKWPLNFALYLVWCAFGLPLAIYIRVHDDRDECRNECVQEFEDCVEISCQKLMGCWMDCANENRACFTECDGPS